MNVIYWSHILWMFNDFLLLCTVCVEFDVKTWYFFSYWNFFKSELGIVVIKYLLLQKLKKYLKCKYFHRFCINLIYLQSAVILLHNLCNTKRVYHLITSPWQELLLSTFLRHGDDVTMSIKIGVGHCAYRHFTLKFPSFWDSSEHKLLLLNILR